MGIAFTALGFEKDDYGKITVRQELYFLKGWSFEELRSTFEEFLAKDKLTLNLHEFCTIFKFPSRRDAEAAIKFFHPNKAGHVDFLKIIYPMIVLSDMSRTSKVSFLFSIVDFDGSGLVSVSEFCIGLESLCMGMCRFFPEVKTPTVAQLEQCVSHLFTELDRNNSKFIDIDEFISWSYRSREMSFLFAPFRGKDKRLFEEAIPFRAVKNGQIERLVERKQSKFEPNCSGRPPKIEGGAVLARRRNSRQEAKSKRPWRKPYTVSPESARILWQVFERLDEDNDNCIAMDEVHAALDKPRGKIFIWASEYGVKHDHSGDDISDGNQNVEAWRLFNRLLSKDFQDRVEESAQHNVSLEGFTAFCWPKITVSEVRMVLGWMRKFKAEKVLRDIFLSVYTGVSDPDLTTSDIKYLFDLVDVNKDGVLSIQEMVTNGHLLEDEARVLMNKLDANHNGKLTVQEVGQVVLGDIAVGAFADGLKAAFAGSLMH